VLDVRGDDEHASGTELDLVVAHDEADATGDDIDDLLVVVRVRAGRVAGRERRPGQGGPVAGEDLPRHPIAHLGVGQPVELGVLHVRLLEVGRSGLYRVCD
jgi:hypothetical protein